MTLFPKFGFIILLFTIFTAPVDNFSQTERIVKIIDSNLFELKSGKLIKLAGVDVPNIYHHDPNLRSVAFEAFKYAKTSLLKKRFDITYPDYSPVDSNYSLVYLIREYPLLTRNYTEEYLKKGFGKFEANVEDIDSLKYLLAQKEGQEDEDGIWSIEVSKENKYDQQFLRFEYKSEDWVDSVGSLPSSTGFLTNLNQTERILMEIVGAPLVAFPSMFIGGFIGGGLGSLNGENDLGNLGNVLFGAYVGYTLGSATGVYIAAKYGDRKVEFGTTLCAGAIGGLSAWGFAFFNQNNFGRSNLAPTILLTLPVLTTIIYVNLIAPKKTTVSNLNTNTLNDVGKYKSLSHKDFYKSSLLFDVELMRINF